MWRKQAEAGVEATETPKLIESCGTVSSVDVVSGIVYVKYKKAIDAVDDCILRPAAPGQCDER